MIPEELKINQLVNVAIGSNSEKLTYYPTRIEGVSENEIQIGIPIVNGAVISVYEGDKVEVSYQVKKDYNQVVFYSFVSRIRKRIKIPIPVMVIDLPDKVHREQKRNYLRMPVKLPCHWSALNNEDEIAATTLDLSGGGCLLQTEEPIEVRSIIKLRLSLPNNVFTINCRVVRVLTPEAKTGTTYTCGLEFDQIRENQRDIIIKYLFELQRTNIKKRRI